MKICGVRRPEDVILAAKLGVDAIGLLVGQRHRSEDFIEPAEAREMIALCPPLVTPVLVTHYEEADQVVALARTLRVTTIQMHSACSLATLARVRKALPDARIIRAVHAKGPEAIDEVRGLAGSVHAVILDTVRPEEDRVGGTGIPHDWNLSRRVVAVCDVPVVLAGGLDASNVARAIAVVRPYGVDANTRLRDAHGFKSAEKVGAFARAAKSAFFDSVAETPVSHDDRFSRP